MHWFKHYNTASQGHTLRSLWDDRDYEAYGLFWIMLELLSRFEDPENRGSMTIKISTISRETGWKPSKCLRVLSRIVSVSKIDMKQIREGYVSYLVPNWLELQENRGGQRLIKNEAKNEQNATEVRSKKLETELEVRKKKEEDSKITNFAPDQLASPISLISRTFKESYLKAYGKEYPGWGAKENGQIRQWLRSISKDQALVLAAAYPFWNDPFVSKRGHPFGLLITNYVALSSHLEKPNAVFQKISSGKRFETEQLEKAENDFKPKVTLQDLLKEAEEKEKNRKEISNDSR